MKCESCKYRKWFGDYNLHYCEVSGNVVEKNDECSCGYVPCKIGDTVWAIRNYSGTNKVVSGKVSEMFFREDMSICIVVKHVARGLWGKVVFGTYEQAKAALEGQDEE